ncbi:phosphotriesterase [Ravibacter arvi]|uniref:Phosphotriesterase n=1 Tax=Ravibacter arvi TaxID=2051041 RepID=A0ABP8LNR7_9BACT
MSFVRTVNGDIAPEEMGVTYSHEHIIIDQSFPTIANPDFLIDDVGKVAEELSEVYRKGGRTMVDTMPSDSGRNVIKLAEVSKRSGIHIVAPTGIHLEIYYPASHWRYTYSAEEMASLFVADVMEGIDRYDYSGPLVKRTAHKAGMIKLATGDDRISDHQRKIFEAVAIAQRETGAPVLTHSNAGQLAIEQAALFDRFGVDLGHVVISHVDRRKDISYHRDLLQTGVFVEYDSAFRWKAGEENWTFKLLENLLPDFPDQITVGMDAARSSYWRAYGGKPGLDYLVTTFRKELADRGLGSFWENLVISNPASLYRFSRVGAGKE